MNKKTKGLLAGGAGAALLLGGGTFALWSDSAQVAGGEITAGNLDVQAEEFEWKDVSEDRKDSPHTIDDLEAFRIIPGDTIEGTTEVTVALEGENMVAQFGVEGVSLDGGGNNWFDEGNATLTVNGNEVDLDGGSIYIGSYDNGGVDRPAVSVGEDGTATFTATLRVEFEDLEENNELDLTQTTVNLTDTTITLGQVRTDAPGYN